MSGGGEKDSNERADGDGRSKGHSAVPATGENEGQGDETAGECRGAQEGDEVVETGPACDRRHKFRVPGADPSDPCESKAGDENAAAAGKMPGDIPVSAKDGDEGTANGDRQHDGIGNLLPAQVLERRNRDEGHQCKNGAIHPSFSPSPRQPG